MSVPVRVCTCIPCHWYSLPSSPSSLECSPCCSRRLWVPGYRTPWRSWTNCEHLMLQPVEGRLEQQFGALCKELGSNIFSQLNSSHRPLEVPQGWTDHNVYNIELKKIVTWRKTLGSYKIFFCTPNTCWLNLPLQSGFRMHTADDTGTKRKIMGNLRSGELCGHDRTLSYVIYCENWMQPSSTLPSCCCSSNLKISNLETPCSVVGSLLPIVQSLPIITKNCNLLIGLVQMKTNHFSQTQVTVVCLYCAWTLYTRGSGANLGLGRLGSYLGR